MRISTFPRILFVSSALVVLSVWSLPDPRSHGRLGPCGWIMFRGSIEAGTRGRYPEFRGLLSNTRPNTHCTRRPQVQS